MKKISILLSAFFFTLFISSSPAFSQKDTTEVKLGKRKFLIIEDEAKKEREIQNLEKGKETFENEIDKAKDESEKLQEMNEELKSRIESASSDSVKTSLLKKIEKNEKIISENDKKIEAFDKGIDEIEKGIAQMDVECDSIENHEKRHSYHFNDKDSSFNAHWSGIQIGFNNFANSKIHHRILR